MPIMGCLFGGVNFFGQRTTQCHKDFEQQALFFTDQNIYLVKVK